MEPKWQDIGLVFVFVLSVSGTAGQPARRGGTLYSASDPLVQLDADSFPEHVYGQPHAWFVEFYASWCGHCQRFAPTWKKLCADVKEWRGVVRLGAVACSMSSNSQLCRAHKVRRYPTIKFFPPNSDADSKGSIFVESQGLDVTSLRHGMVDFIERVAHKPISWPSLEPIPSLQDTWISRSRATRKNILIVDTDDSQDKYLGREVILDMASYHPVITVQRMQPAAAALYGVTAYPAVFIVDENNRLHELIRSHDRKKIVTTLQGLISNHTTTTTMAARSTTTAPITTDSNWKPEKVHMQDLESHLRYSLWSEIGGKDVFSANQLQALKYHMRILTKYHPGVARVRAFLRKVDVWLESVHGNLTGAEWTRKLNELESEDAYINSIIKWTGCAGSQPRFRGYPCSVWVTFHVLTVNALETNIQDHTSSPLEVLFGMRSYVANFFGCGECADHFGEMAATLEQTVRHKGDGVMWLWRAHNRVNKRLHGDTTEDPRHLKVQFPTYHDCPECHVTSPNTNQNVSGWNNDQVLRYLRKLYNKHNIVQDTVAYTWTSKGERVKAVLVQTLAIVILAITFR